ncbi:MAG: SAM-dependent methyltransferase [Prevotellaceae bacterium]|jgi:16S rRNA (cytidine1402-2'-O)-methyltransferase|nr:SAM-dependent methyltransferase [Prevotellaceae bacterium]
MAPTLYLIPTTLGEINLNCCIPHHVIEITRSLTYFIVEDVRTARRYLSKLRMPLPINELNFYELNEHTKAEDLQSLLQPLLEGNNVGLMSEAGVPAVADPGKDVVHIAHQKGIKVVPLVGPSSILLAVMASGLNGQNFAFNGYLPIKEQERIQRIRLLENRSIQERQAQVFIEAPYRNTKLLEAFLASCNDTTMLCIAANLTIKSEWIQCHPITYWKKRKPDINKKPCVFIIQG